MKPLLTILVKEPRKYWPNNSSLCFVILLLLHERPFCVCERGEWKHKACFPCTHKKNTHIKHVPCNGDTRSVQWSCQNLLHRPHSPLSSIKHQVGTARNPSRCSVRPLIGNGIRLGGRRAPCHLPLPPRERVLRRRAAPALPRARLLPPWSGAAGPSAWPRRSSTPSLTCAASSARPPASTTWTSTSAHVVVANSGSVYSTDVADHAVGLLMDVLRRVSAAERFVRRGLWPVQGDYPLGSKVLHFHFCSRNNLFTVSEKKNNLSTDWFD